MKKKVLLLLVAFAAMLSANAQKVTEAEAREKAVAFLRGKQLTKPVNASKMRRVQKKGTDVDAYYVFNVENDGGFVVVSGDDRTIDVLGYSDVGTVLQDSMPDNLKWLLDEYSRQIDFLRSSSLNIPSIPTLNKPAIPPLLSTQWDQNMNLFCPSNCPTGCVATAMAQIMNYHRWPQEACAAIPGYSIGTYKMEDLPETEFNWNLMLGNYNDFYLRYESPNEYDLAVSELMRYCGQSVKMDYAIGSSGASTSIAAEAFPIYFGYSPSTRMVGRSGYTRAQWETLIYHEIENKRPVLYAGNPTKIWTSGCGHAFVCDGFDGDGRFHINWGWGGYCDGFFVLSILNASYPDGSMTIGEYNQEIKGKTNVEIIPVSA